MVNFGQQLEASKQSEAYNAWSKFYIDYGHLKNVIDDEYTSSKTDIHHRKNQLSQGSSLSVSWRSTEVSTNFLSSLHLESEKVSFFVIQEFGRLAAELSQCRLELLRGISLTDASDLVHLEEKYIETGLALLKLIRFVEMNITGFRKILKKHDKIARTKLSPSYLAPKGSPYYRTARTLMGMQQDEPDLVALGNQLLQPLLRDDTIAALACAYEAGTEQLRRHRQEMDANNVQKLSAQNSDFRSRSNTAPNLQLIISDGWSKENAADKPSTTLYRSQSQYRNKMSPWQILLQIHAARGRLYQANEFIRVLASKMMIDAITENDDESLTNVQMMMHRPSKISNFLNLLSTFLYMSKFPWVIILPTPTWNPGP